MRNRGSLLRLWCTTGVLVAVLACLPTEAGAQTYDPPVSDDAYIDFNNPASNFGSSGRLLADQSRFQVYVKFDLDAAPPVGTLVRADLYFWVDAHLGSGEFLVGAVLDPWDEETVTATAPPTFAAVLTSPTVSEGESFVVTEVTAFVQDWLDGTTDNNGFILEIPAPTVLTMRLDSKENTGTGHEPKLLIHMD